MDSELSKISRRYGCDYTRYADDITFSTNKKVFPKFLIEDISAGNIVLGSELLSIIERHQFTLNYKKLCCYHSNEHQEVTGLTVNSKLNVSRSFTNNLRAAINCVKTKGLESAELKFHEYYDLKIRRNQKPSLPDHILGKLEYLGSVKGKDDPVYRRYSLQFNKLLRSHHQLIIFGKSSYDIKFLCEATFVVIGEDKEGDPLTNGTAFFVKDFGFITSNHVFEPEADLIQEVVKWKLISTDDPQKKYNISNKQRVMNYDIITFESDIPVFCSYKLSCNKSAALSDPVRFLGFPNWSRPSDTPKYAITTITRIHTASLTNYIQVDAKIEPGCSGGPILDAEGNVIAIMTYGEEGILSNSGIDVAHLIEWKLAQNHS